MFNCNPVHDIAKWYLIRAYREIIKNAKETIKFFYFWGYNSKEGFQNGEKFIFHCFVFYYHCASRGSREVNSRIDINPISFNFLVERFVSLNGSSENIRGGRWPQIEIVLR